MIKFDPFTRTIKAQKKQEVKVSNLDRELVMSTKEMIKNNKMEVLNRKKEVNLHGMKNLKKDVKEK